MARRSRRLHRRRRRRRGGRSILRRLGIAAALALPLLYFAFTVVLFDPFEKNVPAFHQLVPRDVDLFVRRERLDTDIDQFPVPRFVQQLLRTPAWRELTRTSLWSSLEWPAALERQADDVAAQVSEAPLDPLADLLGREAVVVGRLAAAGTGAPHFALMSRISTRAKLAYELLGWDGVLQEAFPGAAQESIHDPQVPEVAYRRLDIPGGTDPLFYARHDDLLVLGQNEVLVRDILRTSHGGIERSLGLSRLYREKLPAPERSPMHHFDAEFMLDVGQLLAQTGAEETLEDQQRPDALANILDRLIDLTLVDELVGRIQLDGGDLALAGKAELDRVRAMGTHSGLLGAPSFDLQQRLTKVMRLLPDDVSAVVTMNVDLRKFLGTVMSGFDPDLTKLLNSTLRGVARYSTTWKVENLSALATYLDQALDDEVTVAVRPLDHEVPEGSQPLPLMAFILRVKALPMWDALDSAMIRGYPAMGLNKDQMWQQEEGVGTRKWIEMAGLPFDEISYIVLDRERLVIGTSDQFVREIVSAYTSGYAADRRSLGAGPSVRGLVDELSGARANLAGWTTVSRLRALMDPYAAYLAEDATRPNMAELRKRRKAELLVSDYAGKRDRTGTLPLEVEDEVEARLDEMLAASEARRRAEDVPREAARWLEGFAWMDLADALAFGLRLGEIDAEVAVRLTSVLSEER